jgi:hypothetical protein
MVVAILPTGRAAIYPVDHSPSRRLISYLQPMSLWYWRLEGTRIFYSDVESARFQNPGCPNRLCGGAQIQFGYSDISQCEGDSFDGIVTHLDSMVFAGSLRNLGPEPLHPGIVGARVCRRLEAGLALAFLRQVNLDFSNLTIGDGERGGIPY